MCCVACAQAAELEGIHQTNLTRAVEASISSGNADLASARAEVERLSEALEQTQKDLSKSEEFLWVTEDQTGGGIVPQPYLCPRVPTLSLPCRLIASSSYS